MFWLSINDDIEATTVAFSVFILNPETKTSLNNYSQDLISPAELSPHICNSMILSH